MCRMDADEIRRVYLEFMVEQGHVVIPRAPLIPKDDPTTLFTGSGMQPLLPYLLGADHPAGHRLTDSQTCLRVQDIEEVGDNRHTTFFEMLGNWSLGDYFKTEQLHQFWEFLTERVGLDPNRIYVTCFSGDEANGIPKDTESAGIWTELFAAAGISADQVELGTEEHGAEVGSQGARIAFYGKKNWWCRGGKAENMPVGEPGRTGFRGVLPVPADRARPRLRRELPPELRLRPVHRARQLGVHGVQEDRDRVRAAAPQERRLRRRAGPDRGRVDGQPGRVPDQPAVADRRSDWRSCPGESYETDTVAMRVIADHLRGATFLAVDGVRPSNKEQGYVMRRLVRRAVRYAFDLGLQQNFFPRDHPDRSPACIATTTPRSPNAATQVIAVLVKEEKAFRQTLRKGIKQLKPTPRTASPAPSCSPCTTPSGSRSS